MQMDCLNERHIQRGEVRNGWYFAEFEIVSIRFDHLVILEGQSSSR